MFGNDDISCFFVNASAMFWAASFNLKQYFKGILALEQFYVRPSLKQGDGVGLAMGNQAIATSMESTQTMKLNL